MYKTFSIKSLEDAKKLNSIFDTNIDVLDIKLFDEENEFHNFYLEMLKTVEKNISSLPNLKKINLICPSEKISKNEFKGIFEFYKKLPKLVECKVVVNHAYKSGYFSSSKRKSWDVDVILKANSEIYDVCKFIRSSNFSPMEAFAYIHAYVQSVASYRCSNQDFHNWYDNDQFFVGAYLKMPEFVCLGYSSLMFEIIKELNMPGLDSKMFEISFQHRIKKYDASHARMLVKIKDDKYGINQTFFDDPTWDAVDKDKYPLFTHFAMSNKCHNPKISQLYNYHSPKLFARIDETLFTTNFVENVHTFNKSKNKVNQLMIEKIYFRVLKKMYPNKDTDDILKILGKMTEGSFNAEQIRQFKGNIAKKESLLTKEYANKLLEYDKKQVKTEMEKVL